jgi:hypothetical protein
MSFDALPDKGAIEAADGKGSLWIALIYIPAYLPAKKDRNMG